jgi:hypothetical protein
MTKPIFETEVENTLGHTTEWDEHQALIVGVYDLYTFNRTKVRGLIAIQQPGGDELDEWREQGDFRGNTCDEIQMTHVRQLHRKER